MRPVAVIVAALVTAVVLAPEVAHARTAVGVRVAQHPAFVRVVVDVSGTGLQPGPLQASDPDPYPDGRVRLTLPGVRGVAPALGVRRAGVAATIVRAGTGTALRVRSATGRFAYAGYLVLHRPDRLVVDLYRSAPPPAGVTVRYGRPGCLGFDTVTVRRGAVRATGTERDIFEHSFALRLRDATGRPAGIEAVSAAAGRWAATVRHGLSRAQSGTVEAVELSAKDGALSCLVRRRVALQP